MTSVAPALSVIVCCHNAEPFISECIASLCLDVNITWEAVVIDDASTDNTPGILKTLAGKFSNLSCYSLDYNIGLGSARNFAIMLAKGDYIAFLDADDYVDADILKQKLIEAEQSGADIVTSSHVRIYDEGRSCKYINKTKFSGKSAACLFLMRKFHSWSSCISLFRREHIMRNACFFTNRLYYEDVIFSLKAFYSAQAVVTSPEPYYFYRCSNPSITRGNTATPLHLLSSARLYFDIANFIQSVPDIKIYKTAFATACEILSTEHLPRMKPALESGMHNSSTEFFREFMLYMTCKKSTFSDQVLAIALNSDT